MSFFGPGGTGRNIAGLLGDVLLQQTGHQAAFGPAMKQRQLMQFEEQQRQRARMEGREDAKWEWENKPKDPYMPDPEKQARYYESIGDFETAADVRAKARMVPVQQADPNTGEVRYQYVRPTMLMGGGAAPNGDLPRISTPGEAAKLPPGSWFIAPDGSRRRVPGGAAPSNGPGMFPRPY